jgi:ornithine carbamoyltransferase
MTKPYVRHPRMHPNPHPMRAKAAHLMPLRDLNALLASARSLQQAAESGTTQPLLRGKNLGLLCEANDAEADLFCRAASELGAHVSQVRSGLTDLSTLADVRHTARMLGRLYDAVACQGMAPALVRQVGSDAGIPVYDDIASPRHPTAPLVRLLGGSGSEDDKRRYIVQAVLVTSLGE